MPVLKVEHFACNVSDPDVPAWYVEQLRWDLDLSERQAPAGRPRARGLGCGLASRSLQRLLSSVKQLGAFTHSPSFRSKISSGSGPQRRIAS